MRADGFPHRPIHIVVPFPPAGPTDILCRVIAQRMSEDWSSPVVIENQPGANTAIAAARVARMAPDGYTLLAAMDVTLVLNPLINKALAYDPLKDFAPITLASKNTSLLSVRAADGAQTVAELIARAKANPGKLNYGAGILTTRLAGYLFNREAGISVQYIPFNGSAPTVQGLLTGAVDYIVDGTAASLPLIASGQVARARQAQQPAAAGAARGAAACARGGAPRPRRHLDLDRPRRAGGHAARRHGEAAPRGPRHLRRSRDC